MGAMKDGSAGFKAFLEGERLAKLLTNLERGVQGPFWFGNAPSCADFFFTNSFDFFDGMFFDRLKTEFGADPFAAYPKLVGVISGIRNLDSYKNCKLVACGDSFVSKDEMFAAWKK